MNSIDNIKGVLYQLERWQSTIEIALDHGRHTHTFDDIVGMVMANRILFFSFDECFFITEKIVYPQYSVFHCFLAGGSLEALLAQKSYMLHVAKQLECKYLSLAGRKGWMRFLESKGWMHTCSTMYYPIEEKADERRGRRTEINGQVTTRN